MEQKRTGFNKDMINDIFFTRAEVYYIRMILFGFSKFQKAFFFESDFCYLFKMKQDIETKFKTKNWSEIIKYALDNDLINICDYTSEIAKSLIERFVTEKEPKYFDSFKNGVNNYFALKNEIKCIYEDIRFKYKVEYIEKDFKARLTQDERKLIAYKYANVDEGLIQSELNCDKKKLKKYEHNIFDKLILYNWFTVFRYFYQIDLIESSSNVIEKNMTKVVDNLQKVLKSDLSLRFKKVSMYREILIGITVIEFESILNKKYMHDIMSS